MRVLSCPFYAHQDPDLVQKMQHLFRYSLRLLQREGLLNRSAAPRGLSGETWVDSNALAYSDLLRHMLAQKLAQTWSGLQHRMLPLLAAFLLKIQERVTTGFVW